MPPLWQAALTTRLQFRRVILLLINSTNSLIRDPEGFNQLLKLAKELLAIIRANPSPQSPSSSSAAHAAFDPYIARNLNTFLPVRVIDVPTPAQTCDAYASLLDGWEELTRLSKTYHITTWDVSLVLLRLLVVTHVPITLVLYSL